MKPKVRNCDSGHFRQGEYDDDDARMARSRYGQIVNICKPLLGHVAQTYLFHPLILFRSKLQSFPFASLRTQILKF